MVWLDSFLAEREAEHWARLRAGEPCEHRFVWGLCLNCLRSTEQVARDD